jgi:hypothetical protein
MKKEYGQLLTAALSILFGLFALIRFIPDANLAIGFVSLTFGVLAIIWAARARSSLSAGTTLREYTTYFLISLICIVLYSLWDTILVLSNLSGVYLIPKYILVTIAYLVFVFTSYKILKMGKIFGFSDQVVSMGFDSKKKGNKAKVAKKNVSKKVVKKVSKKKVSKKIKKRKK